MEKALRSHRDELIAADTDAKLDYALVKISNARKDRHLKVSLVEGGLEPAGGGEGEPSNYPLTDASHLHAPIRFAVDYGAPGRYFFFVSDAAKNLAEFTGKNLPEVGDKLIAINDQPIAEYFKAIEPYHCYSTVNNLWWQAAIWMPQKSAEFPPAFYREDFAATFERRDGQHYSVTLPYLQPNAIKWIGTSERRYPNFRLLFSTQTYDFYVHDGGKPVALLARLPRESGRRRRSFAGLCAEKRLARSRADLGRHLTIPSCGRGRCGIWGWNEDFHFSLDKFKKKL